MPLTPQDRSQASFARAQRMYDSQDEFITRHERDEFLDEEAIEDEDDEYSDERMERAWAKADAAYEQERDRRAGI
jgi:hypothetical protein